MRNKDELDLLLDSALATYGDPGPDAGFRDRVLSAMASTRQADAQPIVMARPRRSWWPWAIAIPLAACLLFLWLAVSKSGHRTPSQPQQARAIRPTPISPHTTLLLAVPRRATHPAHAVRSEVSPQVAETTPRPLTAQERGLAVVGAQAPQQELRALVEAQREDALSFSVAGAHMPSHEPPTFVDTQHP
jgi:hypothetical protein